MKVFVLIKHSENYLSHYCGVFSTFENAMWKIGFIELDEPRKPIQHGKHIWHVKTNGENWYSIIEETVD